MVRWRISDLQQARWSVVVWRHLETTVGNIQSISAGTHRFGSTAQIMGSTQESWPISWSTRSCPRYVELVSLLPHLKCIRHIIDDPENQVRPRHPIGFQNDRHHGVIQASPVSDTVSFWLHKDKDSMTASQRSLHRWNEAVRRIIDSKYVKYTRRPHKTLHGRQPNYLGTVVSDVRSSDLVKKLEQMVNTKKVHEDDMQDGFIKFLEFSPDGNSLVASSLRFRSSL